MMLISETFADNARRIRVFSPSGTGEAKVTYTSPAVRAANKAAAQAHRVSSPAHTNTGMRIGG